MKPDINSLILFEDKDIIVCHKPAGTATQSARIGTQDMVSLLKNHLSDGHGRPPYLAVIHRLDQPVEGLLVFAKTPEAAAGLSRQLTTSGFGKYYRAVVNGVPSPSEGVLENYIKKDGKSNSSRICSAETPGAKFARLWYHTEKTSGAPDSPETQIKIHLDTGRHHQIRVQMAHIGCPIIGDRKYGDTHAGTLRLCAYRLEFRHPSTGKEMLFELP